MQLPMKVNMMLLSEAFLDNCQILPARYFFIYDILFSMRAGRERFRCYPHFTVKSRVVE